MTVILLEKTCFQFSLLSLLQGNLSQLSRRGPRVGLPYLALSENLCIVYTTGARPIIRSEKDIIRIDDVIYHTAIIDVVRVKLPRKCHYFLIFAIRIIGRTPVYRYGICNRWMGRYDNRVIVYTPFDLFFHFMDTWIDTGARPIIRNPENKK